MSEKPTEGVVICGVAEAFCTCTKPRGHEGPPVCGVDDCGGSWDYADGRFYVVAFPNLDRIFTNVEPEPDHEADAADSARDMDRAERMLEGRR